MTDLEISKALALAIGYAGNHVRYCGPETLGQKIGCVEVLHSGVWRFFDYKTPYVIWKIAERYGCFPSGMATGNFQKHKQQGYPDIEGWEVCVIDYKNSTLEKAKWLYYRADTAAKAVAFSVIGGSK